jgi:hypothetical protein
MWQQSLIDDPKITPSWLSPRIESHHHSIDAGCTMMAHRRGTPSATVTVVKGKLNDTLTIKLRHVKPKLAFDLFTVENSPFISDGTPNGPSWSSGVRDPRVDIAGLS